ncbi:GNAT family N-acetyltransferase, partial [Indiicoccus explosivorum]|uniref:GNAT family N-acetyltransferase n=1 Tax=Indiicoccus explosivorum TaxID=1917864 RepID=UPI0011859F62
GVRGKGIGGQMIREVLKIAFEELKLHRVSLGVFDFNEPAIGLYEKIGFTKEGLLRDTLLIQGEYWSVWEMSLLEDEWPARNE